MTRIGLLSDTHGYLDQQLIPLLHECDEIWHAGDIGTMQVYDALLKIGKPLKAVFGNIDDHLLRRTVPGELEWKVENKTIFMIHIGGFPEKYSLPVKKMLLERRPDIFVCGHSHILKVI